MEESFFYNQFRRRSAARYVLGAAVFVVASSLFLYGFFWRAPADFPTAALFEVAEGDTLPATASRLSRQKLIRSPFWFKAWSTFWSGTRGLKAGDYFFDEPAGVSRLAWRLTHGDYAIEAVSVTLPEGLNNREIAERLSRALIRFDSEQFLAEAKEKEGYLFPDTYRFLPSKKPRAIIAATKNLFERKIKTLESEIAVLGRPLREIIIMASLLEEEARTDETRRKVAGILWKRLDAGMPLQVDGVFPYIFGGKPYDLTNGDLLVDSPYNTYKYAGLPPTPISNPGLAAIRAAITPISTSYWYYLSDKEGNMHYAVTHEEHARNRESYLGK